MNRRPCKQCTCGRKLKYNRESLSRKRDNNIMEIGFSKVRSFATSMVSRGLTNKKADIPVKRLRVLSCFGDGDQIKKCKHLENSVTDGKFYCGGCGCGDKPRTWLLSDGDEYSKLDYPKLNCPLKMPGFSNYQSHSPGDDDRKDVIENVNVSKLNQIIVTSPNPPPETKDE